MFRRIHHVEIVPSDFEKTINFYTQIIGFSVDNRFSVNKPPLEEIAFLRLGDTLLEVFSITEPQPVQGGTWRVGCRRIALEVNDMEKTIAYLKANGISRIQEPIISGTSIRAEFEDPDGISIEMIQSLASKPDI